MHGNAAVESHHSPGEWQSHFASRQSHVFRKQFNRFHDDFSGGRMPPMTKENPGDGSHFLLWGFERPMHQFLQGVQTQKRENRLREQIGGPFFVVQTEDAAQAHIKTASAVSSHDHRPLRGTPLFTREQSSCSGNHCHAIAVTERRGQGDKVSLPATCRACG